MKKLITVLLLAIICLASFASCGDTPGTDDDNTPKKYIGGDEEHTNDVVLNTVHQINYQDSGKIMLADGATDYVVVVPADTPSFVGIAQSELSQFFLEATGTPLPKIVDSTATWSPDAKYISLGNTSVAEAAGVTTDGLELKTSGYIIKTVGNSIFVMGEERGVCNGAYELLELWFGFDQTTPTFCYLERNVASLPLYDFDIVDVPDIDHRLAPYGGARSKSTVSRRMRMVDENQIFIEGTGSHHMLLTIVPYDTNKTAHPKWFMSTAASADFNQLCYTAHGDAAEYEKMVNTAVANMKNLIDADKVHNVATLTQMDYNVWCSCESCQALNLKYGTDAASQIIFVNDVVAKLKPWLETERDGREVEFVVFAYHKTTSAPAKQDETGKWVPIDDVATLKDVSVWLAPIGGNFVDSVYDPGNVEMYNLCESWGAIAPRLFFWGYDCSFGDYLIPYDSYQSMQDLIKENVKNHVSLYWAQGAWNLRANTGFDNVKTYLYSKLMWNCQQNVNELLADYFKKTYREAAPEMEAAYWALRTVFLMQQENGVTKSVWGAPKTETFWPSAFLYGQLEHFEAAKEALEIYKYSDPDFYQTAIDMITLESVSPRYLILNIYPSTLDTAEYDAFIEELYNDCNRLDVNQLTEGTTTASFFGKYGY